MVSCAQAHFQKMPLVACACVCTQPRQQSCADSPYKATFFVDASYIQDAKQDFLVYVPCLCFINPKSWDSL